MLGNAYTDIEGWMSWWLLVALVSKTGYARRHTYVKGDKSKDGGQVQGSTDGGDNAAEQVEVRIRHSPANNALSSFT
jgi:hypothetical protein